MPKLDKIQALGHVTYVDNVSPCRVVEVAYPVWCIDIEATIIQSESFDLIDRYLERAIGQAEIHTAPELAEFLGLDPELVVRVLDFLGKIEHVTRSKDRYALTDLGERSVKEGRRYTRTIKDRRELYLDGLRSHPLRREYYDLNGFKLYTHDELSDSCHMKYFHPISHRDADLAAAQKLAQRKDRDTYNLPSEILQPLPLAQHRRFLLMTAVKVEATQGQKWLLYPQGGENIPQLWPDRVFSESFSADSDLNAQLDNTFTIADAKADRREDVVKWIRNEGVDAKPIWDTANGYWRVNLSPKAVGDDAQIDYSKLGTFDLYNDTFFRIDCSDESVRVKALMRRLTSYFGTAKASSTEHAVGKALRFGRELDLEVNQVAHVADDLEYKDLAAGINRVI